MTSTVHVVGMDNPRISWSRQIPFLLVHLLPLAALWTGPTAADWIVCFALYYGRMIIITMGYHRYFSHRTFKLGRIAQFLLAFAAETSSQKGVLWWAANHRHHHSHSDLEGDVHSPRRGFWWSHVAWLMASAHEDTRWERIRDFARYPELRFLNRYWWLPPTCLAVGLFLVGGWSMLLIGFLLSTTILYHTTFLVNSLSHLWGSRRYATTDTSRNNLLIALLTSGEGWHNNHHHFCASANQGFFWWEIDVTYACIKLLELLGIARDVRRAPASAIARNRIDVASPPFVAAPLAPSPADAA